MSTDDALPWTTSRCNRLLRPISSKLAKLRKVLELPRSSNGEPRAASSAFATKGSPQKTTNFTRPAIKPRGFDKATDPDWRPGAKPGANKKTYAGRGRRKVAGLSRGNSDCASVSRPGEIAFTPLIARMGSQLHSSPQCRNSPLKKYGKNRGPLLVGMELLHNTKTLPADVGKLVQGLSEAYANLLQATAAGNEKRWTGTRSLLGACLRKLPAYIELEEHFSKLDKLEEEEEAEDRDIASEIYEHLESQFEQRAGQGWRPFREVLRAHATSLLCSAITDEVLGPQTLSLLVMHCLNISAWDEAERLLLAAVHLLEPLSFPVNTRADLFDPQRQPLLSLLKSFVDRTGRHRLLYDLLEHMIAFELLPLEWLATECMRPVWDRLVRTISENDPRTVTNALRFMETAMLASMGLPDQRLLEDEVTGSVSRHFVPSSREDLRLALNTTFSSLLTVLCSITLVNNNRTDTVGKVAARRIARVLDAVVVSVATREDIQCKLKFLNADAQDMEVFAQRALWVEFASLAIHLEPYDVDSSIISVDISTLIASINGTADQYSSQNVNFAAVLADLPSFISAIARGTGRIWKDDGFDQLQRLVATLLTTSGHRLPHKLWTLKRLALETAMDFAHDTGDAEHMAYARTIERKMRTQGHVVIVQSPAKNASPSTGGGFRWEEGIGEWVACTPFVKNVTRLPQKNVRPLELLPSPAPSGDDKSIASEDVKELPEICDSSVWETIAFDLEDDDAVLHSSPIKEAARVSTSSLGKRTRASSPMVVIPAKRMQLTPPDSPIIMFYAELPEVQAEDAPRRSRRSTQDLQALTARLRTKRSRTSLESGLRNVPRPLYTEPDPYTASDTESSAFSASSDDDMSDSPPAPVTNTRIQPRGGPKASRIQNLEDDRDELSETPVRCSSRKQRVSKRPLVSRLSGRSRNSARVVSYVDVDDSSADELSFQ